MSAPAVIAGPGGFATDNPAAALPLTDPFVVAVEAGVLQDTDADYGVFQAMHAAFTNGGRAGAILQNPVLAAIIASWMGANVYVTPGTYTVSQLIQVMTTVNDGQANGDQVQGMFSTIPDPQASAYIAAVQQYVPIFANFQVSPPDSGTLANVLLRGAATPVIVTGVYTISYANGVATQTQTGGVAYVPTLNPDGTVSTVTRQFPSSGMLYNQFGGGWTFVPGPDVSGGASFEATQNMQAIIDGNGLSLYDANGNPVAVTGNAGVDNGGSPTGPIITASTGPGAGGGLTTPALYGNSSPAAQPVAAQAVIPPQTGSPGAAVPAATAKGISGLAIAVGVIVLLVLLKEL